MAAAGVPSGPLHLEYLRVEEEQCRDLEALEEAHPGAGARFGSQGTALGEAVPGEEEAPDEVSPGEAVAAARKPSTWLAFKGRPSAPKSQRTGAGSGKKGPNLIEKQAGRQFDFFSFLCFFFFPSFSRPQCCWAEHSDQN